jgi:hypothetical protein
MTAPSDRPSFMSAESVRERARAALWLISGRGATEQINVMADMVAAGEADAYQAGYAAATEAAGKIAEARMMYWAMQQGSESATSKFTEAADICTAIRKVT